MTRSQATPAHPEAHEAARLLRESCVMACSSAVSFAGAMSAMCRWICFCTSVRTLAKERDHRARHVFLARVRGEPDLEGLAHLDRGLEPLRRILLEREVDDAIELHVDVRLDLGHVGSGRSSGRCSVFAALSFVISH